MISLKYLLLSPIVHIYFTPDFRNDFRALFSDTTIVSSQTGHRPLITSAEILFVLLPTGLMLLSNLPAPAKVGQRLGGAYQAKR